MRRLCACAFRVLCCECVCVLHHWHTLSTNFLKLHALLAAIYIELAGACARLVYSTKMVSKMAIVILFHSTDPILDVILLVYSNSYSFGRLGYVRKEWLWVVFPSILPFFMEFMFDFKRWQLLNNANIHAMWMGVCACVRVYPCIYKYTCFRLNKLSAYKNCLATCCFWITSL